MLRQELVQRQLLKAVRAGQREGAQAEAANQTGNYTSQLINPLFYYLKNKYEMILIF